MKTQNILHSGVYTLDIADENLEDIAGNKVLVVSQIEQKEPEIPTDSEDLDDIEVDPFIKNMALKGNSLRPKSTEGGAYRHLSHCDSDF